MPKINYHILQLIENFNPDKVKYQMLAPDTVAVKEAYKQGHITFVTDLSNMPSLSFENSPQGVLQYQNSVPLLLWIDKEEYESVLNRLKEEGKI